MIIDEDRTIKRFIVELPNFLCVDPLYHKQTSHYGVDSLMLNTMDWYSEDHFNYEDRSTLLSKSFIKRYNNEREMNVDNKVRTMKVEFNCYTKIATRFRNACYHFYEATKLRKVDCIFGVNTLRDLEDILLANALYIYIQQNDIYGVDEKRYTRYIE